MRRVSALMQLAGLAGFAAGLYMFAPWLGVTVAGLAVLLVGVAAEPRRP